MRTSAPSRSRSAGQINSANSSLTLRQVMRDVFVVPETKLAVDLLQEFQLRAARSPLWSTKFGSTVGIVTAEDVWSRWSARWRMSSICPARCWSGRRRHL